MAIPLLFDRAVSFRGDLSYFDVQQMAFTEDVMIKDYLGIGEQNGFIIEQLEINVNQINQNTLDIDYNFQYLHGAAGYSPEFSEASSYTKGDYITINTQVSNIVSGNEYVALEDVTAGVFNPVQWREVSTTSNYEYIDVLNDEIITVKNDITDLQAADVYNFNYLNGKPEQPEYDSGTNYSTLYQVVSYMGNAYALTVAPTTGVFNPANWQLLGVSVTGPRLELLIDTVVEKYQFVAYGGLFLDSPPFAFPDINATYQTLDCFDTISFSSPRNIVQNVTNSSLSFTDLGVYEVSISVVFSHNEDNAGRTVFLRTYNLTDNVALGTLIPIFIGRNQPGTNFSYSFPIEFSNISDLNKEVILQVGGGSTLSAVAFETAEYYIKSIGEYRTAFQQTN